MALTLYQPWLHTARCTVVSIQLLSRRMSYHSPLDLSFGEGLGSSIYLYSNAGQWGEGVNICVNLYPTPSSYVEANLQGEGIQRWCVWEVIRWKVEPSWTRSYKRGPGENACPFSHGKTQKEGTMYDTEATSWDTDWVGHLHHLSLWDRGTNFCCFWITWVQVSCHSSMHEDSQPFLFPFRYGLICHGDHGLS